MSDTGQLDLQIGDLILWQGESIELGTLTVVTPGMVGKVLSIHPSPKFKKDCEREFGFSPDPGAFVRFENGRHLLVSAEMEWERIREQ